ncbi:MAG: FtsQ-type POTRA domain-containing protein [Bacillota bacterium]|nr:FtsQ-type POTRA domain-containing protein [Bacillota bacterium]
MFRKKTEKTRDKIEDIDLMEELEYYHKPVRKKGIDHRILMGGAVALVAVIGILLSPVFAAKHIDANGNSHYSVGQLCEKIGLSEGDNILFFGKGKAAQLLEQDPYIADAKISCRVPDTIVIDVIERKVRGYVPYMGAYLYIDEEGRVLDVQDACRDALPMVKGLKFDSFTKGEIIPVENPEALSVVLHFSQMMEKYELLDLVVEIDVSNAENVYAYVNQVQIILGNIENGDTKIRYMAEIMKTIPEEDRGTLDLSELDKPNGMVVFRYLT